MVAKKFRVPSTLIASARRPTLSSPLFFATIVSNRLSFCRVAVVVGTKVDRRSTVRHKIKRIMLHLLRSVPLGSHDVIIHALPAIRDAKEEDLRCELRKISRLTEKK
jgi:ribonuclease P protein component